MSTDATASVAGPALSCDSVRVVFSSSRPRSGRSQGVIAVDGVSFDVAAGRTLAVVGESGCGKSSLARALAGVQRHAGRITVSRQAVSVQSDGPQQSALRMEAHRRLVQMVFQDPYASLDPRRTVGYSISEPIRAQRRVGRAELDARVIELLEMVGLDSQMASRYPHEFSGGQRQRVAIARALGADPAVLVCDEATSALDVSVQAQIVNLLIDAQRAQGFAMVFVTHNLAVVRQLADDVAVMYLGSFVEVGPAEQVFGRPTHPYAQALLSAVPRTSGHRSGERQITLAGDPPDPRDRPAGCHFHPRCWRYQSEGEPAVCRVDAPLLLPVGSAADAHLASCHLTRDIADAPYSLLGAPRPDPTQKE